MMLPIYMAIGGTAGRIISGQLMDAHFMDNILFYTFLMIMSGIISMFASLSTTYEHLVAFAIVFMIFDGGHQAMAYRAANIIFDTKYFNELWSITLVVEALSMMLGPPLVGKYLSYRLSLPIQFSW